MPSDGDDHDDQVIYIKVILHFFSSDLRHLEQGGSLQLFINEDDIEDHDDGDDNDDDDDYDGQVVKSIGCDRLLIRAALNKSVC